MKRSSILYLLLSLLVGLCTVASAASKKPNIIFIMADDLGYGDVGAFGQETIQTPNLDRMAAEGMRFTQHYAGSTVCAPSRCVLMTGMHSGHAIIRGNDRVPLRPTDLTVGELLQDAGYATALIGKWGLGEAGSTGIPNRKGFHYFFGYLNQVHAHNYYPEFLWYNNMRIPLRNKVTRPESGNARQHGGAAEDPIDYSHDLFVETTMNFLDSTRQLDDDQPFFMYLPFTIPHANNEHRVVGRHGMEVPDYGIYEDKEWPEAQKGHAAMITRLDRDVGRILDKLKELDIAENTLVIFTSDNGPHKEGGADPDFFDSNGPLRGIKRDLYEGGIRVPTIAWWPGVVEAGSTTDHISGFQDLLPTAAELAGVDVPADIDGISYAPTLIGEGEQKEHEHLYWEFHERGGKQAIRKGKWKAVRLNVKRNPDGPIELYDLEEDIDESDNIASAHPDKIRELAPLFKNSRTRNPHFRLFPAVAVTPALSSEDALRALRERQKREAEAKERVEEREN